MHSDERYGYISSWIAPLEGQTGSANAWNPVHMRLNMINTPKSDRFRYRC